MAGHLDTTISITVGPEVAGVEVKEPVISTIWPGATEGQVASGVRDLLRNIMAISHFVQAGGSLAASEQFVRDNSTETN